VVGLDNPTARAFLFLEKLIPSSVSKVRRRTTQKNSFGLMPGPEGTCPGATTGVGGCMECVGNNVRPTCYVYKAFRNKKVKEVLEHNTRILKACTTGTEMFHILDAEFTRFEEQEARAKEPWFHYRMHWSGDVFSLPYANGLELAMHHHPKTTFWMYTRSFDKLEPLVSVDNLNLYLSLDLINYDRGLSALHALHAAGVEGTERVKLCYMGKTKPEFAPMTPCPADAGNMEIEKACYKCGMALPFAPREDSDQMDDVSTGNMHHAATGRDCAIATREMYRPPASGRHVLDYAQIRQDDPA